MASRIPAVAGSNRGSSAYGFTHTTRWHRWWRRWRALDRRTVSPRSQPSLRTTRVVPSCRSRPYRRRKSSRQDPIRVPPPMGRRCPEARSEEHTSELQSHSDLVCRLLLEKKKLNKKYI